MMQSDESYRMLDYLVRKPRTNPDRLPLVILLHGVGSNESNLFSLADRFPGDFLVIAARAPLVLSPGRFAWYQVDFSSGHPVINFEQAEKSRALLVRFIDALKQEYPLDEKRICLCGFSQGAIMSYHLALTRPDLVNGMAVLSGRIPEAIKPLTAPNEKLRSLKVFIAHGLNDHTLPIGYARDSLRFLQSLHLQPVYREYLQGHNIGPEMLNDLANWLQQEIL